MLGDSVPDDARIWFCKNTFNVVQVRTKTFVPGVVHEYDASPESVNLKEGGVYNLKCKRCAHDLQIKKIPKLGMLELVPPPPWGTPEEVDAMFRKLLAVTGLFFMVREFVRDPTREEAPLEPKAAGSTECVARMAAEGAALQMFLARCSVFTQSAESKIPKVRLLDGAKPRTRGILLKALLELKMLIVIVVEHLQKDESPFTDRQLADWTNFQIKIHEDCLLGGVEAQYRPLGPSWDELKALVVGPGALPKPKAPPLRAIGLRNPGDNLCASNALLQLLFSVKPFVSAVLAAPELPAKDDAVAAAASASGAAALRDDGVRLVAGLRRLFAELSEPGRRTPASVIDVAATLYGKELGTQQDCDELWHRLALLVEDGLNAFDGRPFAALQQAFEGLFHGATCELRLRSGSTTNGASQGFDCADFEPVRDCAKKPFLTIPVQGGNKSLNQALDDFTSWSSTGGDEIAWTQERFRRVPPYLCFASRQVSDLAWEESLNLTRFVVPSSSSMERRCYERSKAVQLHGELRETLEHLMPARRSLSKANVVSGRAMEAEVAKLAAMCQQVDSQAKDLATKIAELERAVGDGFEEPSLEDFLAGVVASVGSRASVRERLGVDCIKALADKLFPGGECGAALSDLVSGSTACLSQAEADAVAAKLQRRWAEHHAYMFDLHGIVLYQGLGQWGHYVAFIRQAEGPFLCFDDERVFELPDAAAVRAEIAERGGEGLPASVRMVVYRRRAPADVEAAPIEVDGTANGAAAAAANGCATNGSKREAAGDGAPDGADAKRLRT